MSEQAQTMAHSDQVREKVHLAAEVESDEEEARNGVLPLERELRGDHFNHVHHPSKQKELQEDHEECGNMQCFLQHFERAIEAKREHNPWNSLAQHGVVKIQRTGNVDTRLGAAAFPRR